MDHSNSEWTPAENMEFEEALADIDINSSSWFEQLSTRFPSKTPDQLRDHFGDLLLDTESIECGLFPDPIYTDPFSSELDLLGINLTVSPELTTTGLPCITEKDELGENSVYHGAKEDPLAPSNQVLIEVPSEGTAGLKEALSTEIESLGMLLLERCKGPKESFMLEPEGKDTVFLDAALGVERRGNYLPEVTGVTIGKRVVKHRETTLSTKGKQWTEEEHRLGK